MLKVILYLYVMKWFELKLYITNYLHLGLLVVKDITDEELISLIE